MTCERKVSHIQKSSTTFEWGWKTRVAVFDFVMRMFGIIATVAAAAAMAATDETLPFFTQFFQFEAKFSDLPAFRYFVIANGIAGAYLVLSLPISIYNIVRPGRGVSTIILMFCDTVMVGVESSGASAAAAIVDLAHNGNSRANWFSFCPQFSSFCQRVSNILIASFGAVMIFIFLVGSSSMILYRRRPGLVHGR